ncbi:tetratricopeptide repeat protein [Streptomyces sp. NPDC056231]|uniref:tetratricopeptide repeat protein n=1 Tax=Streptomyces sp. NPDC056231 TaxID=3345755 RepID=UPI003AAE087C
MLNEAMVTLAVRAATVLVTAAGTDAWEGLRRRMAEVMARRDTERERLALARLDQTANALASVCSDEAEHEREQARQMSAWQVRVEALLEQQDPDDRRLSAAELLELLDRLAAQGGQSEQGGVNSGLVNQSVVYGPVIVSDSLNVSPGFPRGGTSGSPVVTGSAVAHSTITNVFIAASSVHKPSAWPHQVGLLPRRAEAFQRTSTVAELDAAGAEPGTVLLVGPGGVGKTQAAADFAHRAWQSGSVDLLVWITAASRAAVVAGYAQAAAEITGDRDPDADLAASRFLVWLTSRPAGRPGRVRWLVVLDDVADPADLRGLWPPEHQDGRVLVTTRRRDASMRGSADRIVPVGLFTEDESFAYLAEQLAVHGRQEPPTELRPLAAELGHLPLALSQAAAYLVDAGVDCAHYRRRLSDRATSLADLTPEPGALPDDQTTTLAAAWSLSVESADLMRPLGLSRPMLRLTSLLDPNGVPEVVLTSPPSLRYLADQRDAGAPTPGQPATARDAVLALRTLYRFSLIDHDPVHPEQAVRVLETVQRTTRDSLTAQELHSLAGAAADALLTAWPSVARDSALAQALRANVDALTLHAQPSLYQGDRAHPVLFMAGESLGASGQVFAAREYFLKLAAANDRILGEDHNDALAAWRRFAFWQGESGDTPGALATYEELLERLQESAGRDSPETLITRADLAWRQGHAGDVSGAVTATSDLLSDFIRVLGPDHPSTLTTRHNLAWWRGKAGDIAGAAATTAELLPDFVRVLGPDHPSTLTARHSLAQWRGEAGDAPGAAAAYEELLAHMLWVLGPEHPATLAGRHDLAWWLGQAGDADEAADAYAQVLRDRVRVLGEDHPDTLTTRADLAWWRGQAGNAFGAAQEYEQVLRDRVRVLGEDHPDTLTTRADLAYWQAMVGHTVRSDTSPGDSEAGDHTGAGAAAGCQVELLLLDDRSPGVDETSRIALRLHADPGHPWAVPDSRRRPTLEVVATALGSASIEPGRGFYDHLDVLEFTFVSRRPGRHVIRFTLYENASGAALQQVETELTVTGAAPDNEALVPTAERRRR